MKAAPPSPSAVRQPSGTVQIMLYNWTAYVTGALTGLSALGLALLAPWPVPVRAVLAAAGGLATYWLVASIAASYWVYDRSALRRWDWIADSFPETPRRWANIHVGLDETTPALRRLFPDTHSTVIDVHDPAEMTEPSIRRARRLTPPPVTPVLAEIAALPFRDGELDAVFLVFAAHEIRSPDRRLQFFRELRRVLRPGGMLLLVEHLRDLPNFLAFGPGFLHFHPTHEWRRLAGEGGFTLARESRFTPFVGVFLMERTQGTGEGPRSLRDHPTSVGPQEEK